MRILPSDGAASTPTCNSLKRCAAPVIGIVCAGDLAVERAVGSHVPRHACGIIRADTAGVAGRPTIPVPRAPGGVVRARAAKIGKDGVAVFERDAQRTIHTKLRAGSRPAPDRLY